MNPRELKGYDETLTAIRADLASFQLGWRWPSTILRGMNFGRTDRPPLGQTTVEVVSTIEARDKLVPERLAKRIYNNLLPSTHGLEKKLLQPYPSYEVDPTGSVRSARLEQLHDALFQDVLPDLLPIANAMIERAVKGMLPQNRLGRAMFKKLKVYGGAQHPHQAQQPTSVEL